MSGTATLASGDSGELRTFWAGSIYGVKSQRGLVELAESDADGHHTWSIQITPSEARAIGLSILAAEAADSDTLIVRFLTERVKLSLPQAAQLLGDFRALRDQRQ